MVFTASHQTENGLGEFHVHNTWLSTTCIFMTVLFCSRVRFGKSRHTGVVNRIKLDFNIFLSFDPAVVPIRLQ